VHGAVGQPALDDLGIGDRRSVLKKPAKRAAGTCDSQNPKKIRC
jgi:hypothetical protein